MNDEKAIHPYSSYCILFQLIPPNCKSCFNHLRQAGFLVCHTPVKLYTKSKKKKNKVNYFICYRRYI